MILHSKFVMLHLPKTGSTFARMVIKKAIENKNSNASFLKKIGMRLDISSPEGYDEHFVPSFAGNRPKSEHGSYEQIPKEHRGKPIVTIIRDPYSAFLSRFEFRQRAKDLHFMNDRLSEKFPNFPDLTLEEYIDFNKFEIEMNYVERGLIPEGLKVGGLSLQFIRLFFKNPNEVLQNLSQEYLESDAYKKDIAPITFLRQSHLKEDLYQFLLEKGFKPDEISFIFDSPKANVSKSKGVDRSKIWTPKAIEYIQEYEKLYSRIMQDLSLEFETPSINTVSS